MEEEKKSTVKKWKEKFLELMKLDKTDREIFDEMNEAGHKFHSLSEVRRIKFQIEKPKDE